VIIISIFYELIQYISFLVGSFIHRELGLLIHVPGATTPAGTRWTMLRDSANNVHLGHLFIDLVLLLLSRYVLGRRPSKGWYVASTSRGAFTIGGADEGTGLGIMLSVRTVTHDVLWPSPFLRYLFRSFGTLI